MEWSITQIQPILLDYVFMNIEHQSSMRCDQRTASHRHKLI